MTYKKASLSLIFLLCIEAGISNAGTYTSKENPQHSVEYKEAPGIYLTVDFCKKYSRRNHPQTVVSCRTAFSRHFYLDGEIVDNRMDEIARGSDDAGWLYFLLAILFGIVLIWAHRSKKNTFHAVTEWKSNITSNNRGVQNSHSPKIYGQSGALNDLLNKIDDSTMRTLEDVLQFRENYADSRQKLFAVDNISSELRRLDRINETIEKEKYLMYGAIGETNVINELNKLPKTYFVINDLSIKINPPIYNRAEDDRIYSIQVDHLVVGPTGIFIIETKYWSNKSISSEMLFSPVKQVKRSGFAIFVILNDAIKSRHIKRLVNNWGERKISLKQIVVSINSVPHTEFQYVKVLSIENLNSYITHGKQEFTTEEIQDIVGYISRMLG